GKQDLSDDEWEVYELVVRRFFATVAEPAKWEHLKVVADANGALLKANGKRLLEAGYLDVYPYASSSENIVPDVEEGEALAIDDLEMEAKQTQPPRRRGQSRLIETMEDLGLGTKATRHNTLQKLYDRGYIEGDPPRPTKLAMAVVEAAEAFADRIVDEQMTAQLEEDMRAIAEGEKNYDEVTAESREMLGKIFEELHDSREEIGEHLRDSMKADKTLGPCPECGEDLLVRRSRRGSYFVGCDGFPDCKYTLPLPNQGEPTVLDEECEEHGLRHVKMLAGRNTFVHGCPRCKAEEADEAEDQIIGACPECGEEHGGELAIKQLRSGSRLVGCTRYPDCEYSLPLPRRGDVIVTPKRCDEHDLPHLEIADGEDDDDPWELGCPICNYAEYQERQAASEIEDLDGIGAKTAEKLAAAGVESLDDLRTVDATAVAGEVQGVSEDRIREWQAEANAGATAD
ncbi:DNA topoisomerase, partial [Natronomonas sp.]